MMPRELIQNLLDLQDRYARTYRAIVTGERLGHGLTRNHHTEIEVTNEELREPLIEHVGHLPIIASFLHPYIEHTDEIDLGRVLIILSIHDIGETITGDVFAYKKTDEQAQQEQEIARGLLPESLRPYFDEYETRETLEAKYAKSVDALAPFLHEIAMPKLTNKRLAVHGFGSEMIEAKRRAVFMWDAVLADMFVEIVEVFRKIERGEPTGFRAHVDLE